MRLTLREALEITGGSSAADPGLGFPTYHTDSRQVQRGGLFFALRGAEMDGHEFVRDAEARGAAGVVVGRELAGLNAAQIVVGDTWSALYALAAEVLRRTSPLVAGVTGSNGKTSTKDMLAAALGSRYRVLKTEGNLNTETGVPLTLLQLEAGLHTALVVEMGMQGPGEIARLAALARPTIGVVTVIGTVHLEFFSSREDLARAKGELVAALPEAGTAVLNADDPYTPILRGLARARVVTFGSEGGDYRVAGYEPGGAFSVRGVPVRLALGGRHQARNAAAALAAAEAAGVPLAEGAAALTAVAPAKGRTREVPAAGGFTILDDSYNASPESMTAAFALMAERPARRRLAVLGEMRELGAIADEAHEQTGRDAARALDSIAVVDMGRGRLLAEAAGADLVPDLEAAARWVRAHAQPGDLVLVKASRGVHLEELVEALEKA